MDPNGRAGSISKSWRSQTRLRDDIQSQAAFGDDAASLLKTGLCSDFYVLRWVRTASTLCCSLNTKAPPGKHLVSGDGFNRAAGAPTLVWALAPE